MFFLITFLDKEEGGNVLLETFLDEDTRDLLVDREDVEEGLVDRLSDSIEGIFFIFLKKNLKKLIVSFCIEKFKVHKEMQNNN